MSHETPLPSLEPVESASDPAPAFDPPLGPGLPLRILLAEDSPINQKLSLRMLERMGYRADVAANGAEVLNALRRQSYDVVLMDTQMPEMDGLEAARRIRRLWPEAAQPRIVALTATPLPGDREQCLAAGMDDCLSTPLQANELQVALKRWGARQRTRLASPAPPEPLDRAILAELRSLQVEGEPDLVTELFGMFHAQFPMLMAEMHEAVAHGNAEQLKRLAHKVKGSSGNLGAHHLATLSDELENLAHRGATDGAEARLAQLALEFERVWQAFETEHKRG